MKINNSPWIHQLSKERPHKKLEEDLQTDVAIIGAGIAGMSTAFYLLKYTDKKVVLIEKSKIAYGATGHNAGQIVSYFEKPLYELVEEFGLEKAARSQRAIEMSWELLEEIYTEASLNLNLSRFTGYDGFSTYSQIETALKNNKVRKEAGLPILEIMIDKNSPEVKNIISLYDGLYKLTDNQEIQKVLETNDTRFIATMSDHKGVMNSALFTDEIGIFLLKKYPERFSIYEHTKVSKVILKNADVLIDVVDAVVSCQRVVLCTNGFENFEILDQTGLAVNTKFHHEISGVVGRMSGYLEKKDKEPAAISYYMPDDNKFEDMEEAYFYLTRRAFDNKDDQDHNLVCVGGPQHVIADREEYLFDFEYPEKVQKEVDDFIKTVYDPKLDKELDYKFAWHGLMGYTPSRVRLIGEEPLNNNLLYNLGCNGVGILPSIYGGKRISRIIAGEKLEPSIFDPKRQK